MDIHRFFFLTLTALAAVLAACTPSPVSQPVSQQDRPTDAYKRLYAAVKNKDTEAIKRELSKKTISLAEMSAQRFNKTPDQAFENGMTATTFSETLPTMRDERIKGNMGALEVWNSKDNKWEDVPFILEDGAWKLAIGDGFAGSYQWPGKGQDFREKEAANAVTNRNVIIDPKVNMNSVPSPPRNSK